MMRWDRKQSLNRFLFPLSAIFSLMVFFRRWLYQKNLLKTTYSSVPVIVIGNITVGGSGKTPLTIFLASFLKQKGFRPGIVSRGYKGSARQFPQRVDSHSDPKMVGDEPVLMAMRTGLPVVIDRIRARGVQHLVEHAACDLVLCDDGLQHYALARDLEIAVIDGEYRFGNGYCLPAGPLREPVSRLQSVDLKVAKKKAEAGEHLMEYAVREVYQLINPSNKITLPASFNRCHVVAGIARPTSFFDFLRPYSLEMIEHAFPDHYDYSMADFSFGDDLLILMTEKDAVKCKAFADERFWVVSVDAILPESFCEKIVALLSKLNKKGVT